MFLRNCYLCRNFSVVGYVFFVVLKHLSLSLFVVVVVAFVNEHFLN